jgi:hypothetical protein
VEAAEAFVNLHNDTGILGIAGKKYLPSQLTPYPRHIHIEDPHEPPPLTTPDPFSHPSPPSSSNVQPPPPLGACKQQDASRLMHEFCRQICVLALKAVGPDELSRARNMLKCNVLTQLESRIVLFEDLGRQLVTYGFRWVWVVEWLESGDGCCWGRVGVVGLGRLVPGGLVCERARRMGGVCAGVGRGTCVVMCVVCVCVGEL